MDSYLVVNFTTYLDNYQKISEDSHIVALDYYVYSKIKHTKRGIHFINEFTDDKLIESWLSFVENFLQGLSQYLYDETLKKEKWLNCIDRPLIINAMQDFNMFNVIPRLIYFFLKNNIKSCEIIGNMPELFYFFLKDITQSLDIKIINSYSIDSCSPVNITSQKASIGNGKQHIKRFFKYITNLGQQKRCIIFPSGNMFGEVKKELIKANFDLAIINPTKKTLKNNITNAAFYFTGLRNYQELDASFVKIKQIFNQIDFTESLFRLVEVSFKKISSFWYKEKQYLKNWITKKEPLAIIVSDVQDIVSRLLIEIGRENSVPTFHFPHGFDFIRKRQLGFAPLQLSDYITVPNMMTKNYFIDKLNIESNKLIAYKVFQVTGCNTNNKINKENIVVLEYGLSATDLFEDYSLLYQFPYETIFELSKIFPDKKIIYRERPNSPNGILTKIRKHLETLYKKSLFTYDKNRYINETLQSAKFVIGSASTVFFEALACNIPFYCYVPPKLEGPPPFTSENSFVFNDISKINEVLNREYPLQFLKDNYLTNNSLPIGKIITEEV